MKSKEAVIATIYSNAIHNEQILCAAKVWAERNSTEFILKCEVHKDPYYITIVMVEYDDLKLLFDMSDSPALVQVRDRINVYYKRSYIDSGVYNSNPYPVLPFGFNYGVTANSFSFQRLFAFGIDKVFAARSLPLINYFTNLSYSYINYKKMHKTPQDSGGRILFLTRLWDPATVRTEEKKLFRQHLNTVRIETVRQLKQQFRERVTAGITDSHIARKLCPELIVTSGVTSKKNYLHTLQKADICIATNGLENTLGWRIAEYVAFSKAVVSEPFSVTVPDWEEKKHYSIFNDDLNAKVDALLYGKNYLHMQQHNYEYYQQYLEPEMLFKKRLLSHTIK